MCLWDFCAYGIFVPMGFLCVQASGKMLMKLTPGVWGSKISLQLFLYSSINCIKLIRIDHFTRLHQIWRRPSERHLKNLVSISSTFYMRADPKSAKNTVKLSVLFALLGSAWVKAAVNHWWNQPLIIKIPNLCHQA